MPLKTMDPEQIRALLLEHEDVLSPMAQAEAELFNHAACPVCFERGAQKHVESPRLVKGPNGDITLSIPFSANHPLPKTYAVCPSCGTEFDPRTGIIRKSAPIFTPDPREDPR